jgi:cytochrome c oxidase subunit 2
MMAFDVRVVEPDEFDAWLARQSESASTPTEEVASLGARRFLAVGCGACHTIRGTEANGSFGPDLTHVGSRATIGAATLANDHAKLADWTRRPDAVKPGVLMPSFDHLSDKDIEAITIYLKGLQ